MEHGSVSHGFVQVKGEIGYGTYLFSERTIPGRFLTMAYTTVNII
jgi:hypothetical protein